MQRGGRDQAGPHEVADQEDLTAPPAVDEGSGEGADDAERQQHDDQRAGDAGRVGHVLWPEEEQRRQPGLHHPVAGLGDEADAEQGAEGRDGGEVPEVGGQAHGSRLAHARPGAESARAGLPGSAGTELGLGDDRRHRAGLPGSAGTEGPDTLLGTINAITAVVCLVPNLVFGSLSDRTRSRLGQRAVAADCL